MTCIAAIRVKNAVYMAADSAATYDDDTIDVRAEPKLFRVGEFLLGHAGGCRTGNVIQHHLTVKPQRRCEDDHKYMVAEFANSVRETLQMYEVPHKTDAAGKMDSDFLVAYRNKLYVLYEDFEVAIPTLPWAAIGSGAKLALGSMYSTREWKLPRRRLQVALEAAELYVPSVRRPFLFENTNG